MILTFSSEQQGEEFYALMGKYFASLDIAKELEQQLYNMPNTEWFIAYSESVVGFASVRDCGKYYYLDNLYVVPQQRNTGTATEIVEYIVKHFQDKPIKLIAVNPYSIRIFERYGFEKDGKNGKWNKYIKH